jgi:phage baseplate assembly protein V
MPPELLHRLRALEDALQNVLREGVVEEIQHAPPRCRVRSGKLLTDWLPWYCVRAGSTRTWSPPTAGEQCTVLSPSGNLSAGRVLIGLYCNANPAPSESPDESVTRYPDGASTTYNHATHTLTVVLPTGGNVTLTAPSAVTVNTTTAHVQASGAATLEAATITATASTSASISAPAVEITATATASITAPITTVHGPLNVLGPLSFAAGMSGQGGGSGAAVDITGSLATTAEVTAAGIPLSSHTHHVPEHEGTSGPPQA